MRAAVSSELSTVVDLLRQLIRFDTSNPPGQERECAIWLHSLLEGHGIESRILASDAAPDRPSVVARVEGSGSAPPLLLQGHIDVVGVQGQTWSHDPFSADIADGCVWGRGAVDMKGGLAMMLHAILKMKQDAFTPPGDIVLAAVADEEMGGVHGAKFLVAEHPELFEGARHALGEVGGFTTYIRGKRFYPVMVAEKHICRLRVTFRGLGGHGSQIHSGTAMSKAASALHRLERHKPRYRVVDAAREMTRGLAAHLPFPANAVMRLAMHQPTIGIALKLMGGKNARMFEPMLRNVINPTIIEGGRQENAVPAEVSLLLDCRLLPGSGRSDLVREVREIVGEEPEIEVARYDTGPSTVDMSLMPFLSAILERSDPGSKAIPFMVAGGTDAKWFETIGIETYGFTPMRLPPDLNFTALFHGADERIPIDALEFGASLMYEAITTYRG